MSFETEKYQIVKNALSEDAINICKHNFEMLRNQWAADNFGTGHKPDRMVKDSFSWYSSYTTDSLMVVLKPKLEEITGKRLLPTYSYGRIYYTNAEMAKHIDRYSCEISATVCITADETPWPIWFKTEDGEEKPLTLHPGDLCVYRGCELEHWRLPNPGNECIQMFVHFVDADGPYTGFAMDLRDGFGQSYNGGNCEPEDI
jgi:hypothetical protein